MKVGAIVETRMNSSRLPGKVMLPILGKPSLSMLVERLRQTPILDEIIIATTTNHWDLVIVDLASKLGVKCYRGSENDVLGRVYEAGVAFGIDVIVEITSDCPLVDPELIERAFEIYKSGRYDYVSNVIKRTYPRGLDVQVFSIDALRRTHEASYDPVDREHVTLFMYEHPEQFKLQNFVADNGMEFEEQRLTLDTPEDYFVIRDIFEALYPKNKRFRYREMFTFLKDNPAIASQNRNIKQKRARDYDFTEKAQKALGIG